MIAVPSASLWPILSGSPVAIISAIVVSSTSPGTTSPARIFSRKLLDSVRANTVYVDERAIVVHVGRLRKRLNAGRRPHLIRTVRGAG